MRAVDVFVPSDFPTYTYVERGSDRLERKLRNAIETPKSPISISGPSKTGKTALVKKIVGEDNLIHIFGTQINSEDSLWRSILEWMDTPSSKTISSQQGEVITPNASTQAEFGVPGVAKYSIGGGVSAASQRSDTETRLYNNSGMTAVAKEIGNSEFIVFLDDFHYIKRELQDIIGKQIKTGSEIGIRFCIASVPHRSDDVVRSNHELRGRTINIDTSFWSKDDLFKIAQVGFEHLNVAIPRAAMKWMAHDSCTSPQIMQALCLQLCFNKGVRAVQETTLNLPVQPKDMRDILEQTSTRSDYSSLVRQMHAGPRIRGTERKEFEFADRSVGDVYRAVLLALKENPPSMSYNYADMLARIAKICTDDKPVGSSVTETLKQISHFADLMMPNQKVLEWDPDAASGTISIIDPYFLFFLRSSDLLSDLSVRNS